MTAIYRPGKMRNRNLSKRQRRDLIRLKLDNVITDKILAYISKHPTTNRCRRFRDLFTGMVSGHIDLDIQTLSALAVDIDTERKFRIV